MKKYIITEEGKIRNTETNSNVPPDPNNEEYQEYTKWVHEGNVPDDEHPDLTRRWRETATISRRRFKIGEALYKVNGVPLKHLIAQLLNHVEEPERTIATIAYEESGSFDRLDPFVVKFGKALNMSDRELDEFFIFCISEAWKD